MFLGKNYKISARMLCPYIVILSFPFPTWEAAIARIRNLSKNGFYNLIENLHIGVVDNLAIHRQQRAVVNLGSRHNDLIRWIADTKPVRLMSDDDLSQLVCETRVIVYPSDPNMRVQNNHFKTSQSSSDTADSNGSS